MIRIVYEVYYQSSGAILDTIIQDLDTLDDLEDFVMALIAARNPYIYIAILTLSGVCDRTGKCPYFVSGGFVDNLENPHILLQ